MDEIGELIPLSYRHIKAKKKKLKYIKEFYFEIIYSAFKNPE